MEKVWVRALYDYTGETEDNLSFKKGDMLVVKEKTDGWWAGEKDGNIGWFPASYVKELDEENLEKTKWAKALCDYTGDTKDNLSFKKGDMMIIKEKKTEGWWAGERAGKVGWFPASYVEEKDPFKKTIQAKALFNFIGKDDTNLSLQEGDVLVVLEKSNGWWKGEKDTKIGWFPASYVNIINT
uniref:SH3 domain-containing protein n=1 Tax=Arcella intermedia TaxID=1963864 RepID=A0A6B2LIX1_9EUKA